MTGEDTSEKPQVTIKRSSEENWSGIPAVEDSKERVFEAEVRFYNEPNLDNLRDINQFVLERHQSSEFKENRWNEETQVVYSDHLKAIDTVSDGKATDEEVEVVTRLLLWQQHYIDGSSSSYDSSYYGNKIDPVKADKEIETLIDSINKR